MCLSPRGVFYGSVIADLTRATPPRPFLPYEFILRPMRATCFKFWPFLKYK